MSCFWHLCSHIADSIMFTAHTLPPAVWPSCLSQLLINFLPPGESRFCSHLSVSWRRFPCSKFLMVLFLLVVQEEPHPLRWCLYPTCNITYKPCPRHGFCAMCPVCWLSPCSGFALFAAASSKRYGSFQRESGRRPADFLLIYFMLPRRRNKFLSKPRTLYCSVWKILAYWRRIKVTTDEKYASGIRQVCSEEQG